jgi:hypothetical protein
MHFEIGTLPTIQEVFGPNYRAISALGRAHIHDITPLMVLPEQSLSIRDLNQKTVTRYLKEAGIQRRTYSDKLVDYLKKAFTYVEVAPASVLHVQVVYDSGFNKPMFAYSQLIGRLLQIEPRNVVYDIVSMGWEGMRSEVMKHATLDEPLERSIRDIEQEFVSLRWRLDFLGIDMPVPQGTNTLQIV